MFLGWYDPEKKKSTQTKVVLDAIERYREKFGSDPAVLLTSAQDVMELGPDAFGLTVRPVSYIGRYTYYVGVEEPSELAVTP